MGGASHPDGGPAVRGTFGNGRAATIDVVRWTSLRRGDAAFAPAFVLGVRAGDFSCLGAVFATLVGTDRLSGSTPVAMFPNGAEELSDVDGLGHVPIEACREEPLAVAVHRLRGDREHGDRGGPLIGS
jgi:hypothetical protein